MQMGRVFIFFLCVATLRSFGNEGFQAGVAAIVNEKVITLQQLEEGFQEHRAENLTLPEAELRKEVLDKLIEQALIVQEFESRKGKIFDVYLENYVQSLVKENFEGKREFFLEYLRQKGQTYRQFQQDVKESIIVREMVDQKIKSSNEISPKAIEEYYQANLSQFTKPATVKIQQIAFKEDDRVLLKSDEMADNEAPEEAVTYSKYNIAQEKIRTGATFKELAEALQVELMEGMWLERTEMSPQLAESAFALEKDTYSAPVLLDGRYFILFLEDKKEQHVCPLSEVQSDIETQLLKDLNHQIYKGWILKLREKAFIRYG